MSYNIHYDIAAMALMVVLLIYFYSKKNIRTTSTMTFAVLLWVTFATEILDCLSAHIEVNIEDFPLTSLYIFNMLYLIFFNSIPVIYNLYLLTVVKEKEEWTWKTRLLLFGPYLAAIIHVFGTPWTGIAFSYDAVNGYERGPLFYVLYVIAFYYIGFSWAIMVRYQERLTKSQQMVIWVYTVLCLGGSFIQTFMPHILIVQFCISVSMLLAYLSLEVPDDDLDNVLGVYNRKGFLKILKRAIEKNKSFEVEIFNIDNYHVIRDILGLEKSRMFLRQSVEALSSKIKKVKLFSLNEGQIVVFTEKWEGISSREIHQIRKILQKTVLLEDVNLTLSVSNFELVYPRDVKRLVEIVDLIDYAQNFVIDEEMEGRHLTAEMILENRRRENQITHILQRAIANEEFMVYYQPIYSVEEGCFSSAEALIRLHDEKLGFISPEVFIPLAEQNGMIFKIGEFVFRSVCKMISENNLEQYGMRYIEVNLSAAQCVQENLHKKLLSIMDEYGVPHSFINLEITETAVTVSKETLRKNMDYMVKQGVTFSMDDYGTGYSNINSLITYPFHLVKMDKSIIWYAMKNDLAMCALKHSINMAKDLGMCIVAEGVETKEQSEELQKMGCDYLQGYYYSKPIPPEEFVTFLAH